MPSWLIPASLLLLAFAVLAWRYLVGKRRPDYLAVTEYWVYSNAQRIPPTEAIMDEAISKNPFNRPDRASITSREGLLFSDIRLQIAIAKREKNPHAFRPDLFDENAVPSQEVLERLAGSSTIAKIKYASNVPLTDKRHLQFLVHLAASVGRMLRSKLVFDTITERFWLIEELNEALLKSNDAERPELHVRIVWKKSPEGCFAETLGLRKVGIDELRTSRQEPDMETLVCDVLHFAALRLFSKGEGAFPIEYAAHGDTFVVTPDTKVDGRQLVKISRKTVA